MSELKAHEFDSALSRIARQFRIFLLYGPDRGLVWERAAALAEKSGVDLADAFSFVRLEASDLAKDPARLADEAHSIGLFGGDRLIWLRTQGTEKPVTEALSRLLAAPLSGSTLIIEAGDLKKGVGIRKQIEASSLAVAIPCYADDAKALNILIDQELAVDGLNITAAARVRLLEILGGDRLASRNEIRKLALYCRGQSLIDEHHVIEIVGDASAISTDEAVDAVLSGDVDGFLHAIQKVILSKTSVFLILQGVLRQFQLLDLMRAEMEQTGQGGTQIMATLARHMHFKRKSALEQALRQWSTPALKTGMDALQAAILQTRQRASLENSITIQLLLALTLQSRRK